MGNHSSGDVSGFFKGVLVAVVITVAALFVLGLIGYVVMF